MARQPSLNRQDREFFSLVAEAIFANPFEAARKETLKRLLPEGQFSGTDMPSALREIGPALDQRLAGLEAKGLDKIQTVAEEDRILIEQAFLLQVYLKYEGDMDQLIQNQRVLGDTPAAVPFAAPLLAQLKSRGMAEQKCLRYLALFYQLRRAFFFITRALVGGSDSMKQLRLALWNNVFTCDVRTYDRYLWNRMEDFSTLLLGETGTGKGSAASAIGRSGFIPFNRETRRFEPSFMSTLISINLSQFPETLIESELFGHRKGAFTGAVDHYQGRFELCSPNGALFLDEIGDVSIPIQIKLLQVLQERTFTPVGSHVEKRFEGRVIAATNRSVDDLRRQGNFRDDFFYRLCSDVITVPLLRQRIAELPSELEELVRLLVNRMTGEESTTLVTMILEILDRDLPANYPWPGNVRELEQAVRRILLSRRYQGDTGSSALAPEEKMLRGFREGELTADELLGRYCAFLYERHGTYEEVARRTELNWRTVRKILGKFDPSAKNEKR